MENVEKLMCEIERLNMIIEDRAYSDDSNILASDCYFEIGDLLGLTRGSVVDSVSYIINEQDKLVEQVEKLTRALQMISALGRDGSHVVNIANHALEETC